MDNNLTPKAAFYIGKFFSSVLCIIGLFVFPTSAMHKNENNSIQKENISISSSLENALVISHGNYTPVFRTNMNLKSEDVTSEAFDKSVLGLHLSVEKEMKFSNSERVAING